MIDIPKTSKIARLGDVKSKRVSDSKNIRSNKLLRKLKREPAIKRHEIIQVVIVALFFGLFKPISGLLRRSRRYGDS